MKIRTEAIANDRVSKVLEMDQNINRLQEGESPMLVFAFNRFAILSRLVVPLPNEIFSHVEAIAILAFASLP